MTNTTGLSVADICKAIETDPELAHVRQMPGGEKVGELWVPSISVWIRLSDCCIQPARYTYPLQHGYLYPNWIQRLFLRWSIRKRKDIK